MWRYYAILSAVFAAFTAILAKLGVKGVNPNIATAIRTVIILFIAWGIVVFSGEMKEIKQLSKLNIFFLVLSGIATGLSWIFYFKALSTGEVSKVAPIDKLSVAITIVLSFIILKEPIEAKTIIGGALIIAGSLVLTK